MSAKDWKTGFVSPEGKMFQILNKIEQFVNFSLEEDGMVHLY